ncbi:AMIN-like domain-containing (lipo)protein [Streptomyces sp. NPDC005141]
MQHHRSRAAIVAGVVLTAVGSTVPASAAMQPETSAKASPPARVVNARWAGHCTFDRLVIDVRGSAPTVSVKPIKTLRYDPSGKKVPLAGKYFLNIRLSPAVGHDDAGNSLYKGPRLVKIQLSKLKGLALTGDFEGVVSFGTAFQTKPTYKVYKLHSPERVVLDFNHANRCG